ncbi:hypothetical protein [Maritalea sp.]|jgi:hypothetical protein|uniref:hypothetical protein n=1 Tax=Maritalea sp. TaxID=2003361 RepID=UPI0039E398B8
MLIQIFTKTPIWVWPLLVLLVALGLRASRKRWMPAAMIYVMPLLGILSLNNMLGLPNPILVWATFVVFYVLGASIGFRLQSNWTLARDGNKVHVAGEWVTMFTIILVFLVSFLNGLFLAILPELVAMPAVYLGLTIAKAVISGIFIGRAAYVWHFMNKPVPHLLKAHIDN